MPHCIIEYSEQLTQILDPKRLLSSVHQGTLSSALFSIADIKVRAMPYTFHSMASENTESAPANFVHVVVKILSGRTLDQRSHLSVCVLNELKKLALSSVSITVEICDIEKPSYSKLVLP